LDPNYPADLKGVVRYGEGDERERSSDPYAARQHLPWWPAIGARAVKAVVRPFDNPELEENVARLRILAYPYFPEVHDVEFYSSFYRWFESHPLADEVHRWIVVNEDEEVVGHLAATTRSPPIR
jgi:hypothetical protein